MTEQEIKDNTPEGATHIDGYGDYWRVSSSDVAHFFMNGKWFRYAFRDHEHYIKIGQIKPL